MVGFVFVIINEFCRINKWLPRSTVFRLIDFIERERKRKEKSSDNDQTRLFTLSRHIYIFCLDEEDEKKSSKKGKRIQRGVKGLQLPDKPRPITLFLDLEDMKEVTPETVPGLSPCWSHLVHVVQSRDLPLDPKDVNYFSTIYFLLQ